MFEDAISKETRQNLELLNKSSILPSMTYLAGGTALALYLGHRLSYDLDFFTPTKFQTQRVLEKLKRTESYEHDRSEWGTILGRLDGIKFSLFYYPYSLLDKTASFGGAKLASLSDIAAMKIAAVSERGSRKDFIDLYFLARKYSLSEMIGFYEKKYQKMSSNLVHIKKSLVYFHDAESEVMPNILQQISWKQVKDFFEKMVKEVKIELN